MEQTLIVSAIFGTLAKPLIDIVKNIVKEKDKQISVNEKKLLSVVVCIFLGTLVAIGEGLLVGEITPQNMVINLATVISVSQAVHNYTKT